MTIRIITRLFCFLAATALWVFSICSDGVLVMEDRTGLKRHTTEQDVLTALRTGTAKFAEFQRKTDA